VEALLYRSGSKFALSCFALGFALSAPGAAGGRCAYVDIDPVFAMKPEEHCFNLEARCAPDQHFGCFKVPLEFKEDWIRKSGQPDMRELAKPFGYIDPQGTHWDVPAGFVTDGASIPLFFQPLIGGPWTENYVKAAVVHDFYIRRSAVKAQDVHKMFFSALLAGGTDPERAKQMGWAVLRFGPHWKQADLAEYERAWRAREEMMSRLDKWWQDVEETFKEKERKRLAKAEEEHTVLGLPLKLRTRVFMLPKTGDPLRAFDDFLSAAARDKIVDEERDGTHLTLMRKQMAEELNRPVGERNNVLVIHFTNGGLISTAFKSDNDAELAQQLDMDMKIVEQQESVDQAPVCLANCAAPPQ
jgi:hypothetical protein